MEPKVTIIWVNYNSMRIIDVVKESLRSVLELDYPDYEVIIVDNGSTDGSLNVVRRIIVGSDVPVKLIRLSRNRGFNAANNVGFRARDRRSKYVALVNNDAAVERRSLGELVRRLEEDTTVAGAQGIITDWEGRSVDNAGFIVDELLFSHPLHRGLNPEDVVEERFCTFISGAYSIYRISAVVDVNAGNRLFDDHMFAYFDDKVLGMRLWSRGYRLKSYPFIAARHFGSASFGRASPTKLYLTTRNFLTFCKVVKGLRYLPLMTVGYPIRRLAEAMLPMGGTNDLRLRTYAVAKGLVDVGRCLELIDYEIRIADVPVKRLSLIRALRSLVSKLGQ